MLNDGEKSVNQFLYFLKPVRFGLVTEGPTPEEADDESAARNIMENDPAVVGGVLRVNPAPSSAQGANPSTYLYCTDSWARSSIYVKGNMLLR